MPECRGCGVLNESYERICVECDRPLTADVTDQELVQREAGDMRGLLNANGVGLLLTFAAIFAVSGVSVGLAVAEIISMEAAIVGAACAVGLGGLYFLAVWVRAVIGMLQVIYPKRRRRRRRKRKF